MNWLPGSAADETYTELLYKLLVARYEELCLPDFNVAQWHFPDEALFLFFFMSLEGQWADDIWYEAMHISFGGSNFV